MKEDVMVRPLTPRELLLLVLLALAVLGCGGEESVTGPEPLSSVAPSMAPPHAALPPHIFGAFASSADVPEIGPQGGNVVLVVPTYADDPERVALALQANGKVAIVSAHHVFGGPRETWGVDPAPGAQALAAPRAYQIHGATAVSVGGWLQTRDWMKPLEARGLVAAVYVVDEPLHNGIPAARRDEAIAIVHAAGYRTVVAEWVDRALITPARPPVDLYGVTCYSWPGPGSWSLDRCVEAYRTHPGWDLVFAQGFDLQQTTGYNGAVAAQIARWAALPRDFGRAGVLFWVARWPGQTGILDDPEMLAAYRKASSR
jgi:hypothetical protein